MIDWDDAFDNSGYIDGADTYFDTWAQKAVAARVRLRPSIDIVYGTHSREKLDFFSPDYTPKGLIVFVHGGYWQRMDKSYFSHLASGPVDAGWAVAIISYPLAPEVGISDITSSAAIGIEHAARLIDGPIGLIGHSAGGHLVSRMMCGDLLDFKTISRISKVISVSGVHDLRPLCETKMNNVLNLTADESALESPALLKPHLKVPINFWVGAEERPEFLRQTRLITEKWQRLGANVSATYEAGKHHFNVIEALEFSQGALTLELLM